jgi:hypothetical protein
MQEHISYWQNLADRKILVIFGPVLDPNEVYGIAIIETVDELLFEFLFLSEQTRFCHCSRPSSSP